MSNDERGFPIPNPASPIGAPWTDAELTEYHRSPDPHPLCTCPPITFAGPNPDRSKCAGGETAHPVLSRGDLDQLLEAFHRDR